MEVVVKEQRQQKAFSFPFGSIINASHIEVHIWMTSLNVFKAGQLQ